MIDNIPPQIAAPLALILGLLALYRCYILPGYRRDKLGK